MGKKRKTGGGGRGRGDPARGRLSQQSNSLMPERTLLDPTSRDFVYDEADDFEEEEDRVALSNAKRMMARKKQPQEQVLGIDVSSSDSEEEEGEEDSEAEDQLFMEDDIVEEVEERVADDRAWGRHKRSYIGTDTSDERILKKLRTEDEEVARLEEETARKLQQRMAAELHHLLPDDLITQEEDQDEKEGDQAVVDLDLSHLSRANKLQLLQRESPEFLPLIQDLKEKLEELKEQLVPLMEGVRLGLVASDPVSQYITTKYRLVINYVCVLSTYVVIKSSQGSVRGHPVVGRLAQYRQLLQELKPCDEGLKTVLRKLMPRIKKAMTSKACIPPAPVASDKARKQKQLQLLSKKSKKESTEKRLSAMLGEVEESGEEEKEEARGEAGQQHQGGEESSDDQQQDQPEEEEAAGEEDSLDPEGKRSITYQISKNKGLLPSRKKEQRNPRVKYRRKYKDKIKKRKGQVREVRKELKRYEGEVSGIKPYTVKSIKIK